jgi:hypothetical protein
MPPFDWSRHSESLTPVLISFGWKPGPIDGMMGRAGAIVGSVHKATARTRLLGKKHIKKECTHGPRDPTHVGSNFS